jgi:general stress protein YciG
MTIEPKKRGFALMDKTRLREISSMGGKAIEPRHRSFSVNRELAKAAGSKGGKSHGAGFRRGRE